MLITSIKISLCTIAIYQTFQKGMIFHFICRFIHHVSDEAFGKKWGEFIRKPICGCLICMASVWTLIFTIFFKISLCDIPFIILIVCGLNTAYVKLISHQSSDYSVKQQKRQSVSFPVQYRGIRSKRYGIPTLKSHLRQSKH